LGAGRGDRADPRRDVMTMPINVGAFSDRQKKYLEFHRKEVFKKST
jgi:hypothetical protein